MNRYFRWLLLPSLLCGGTAAAQTEGSLDSVTVTATLSPQQSSRTGRNVQVFSGSMFQQLPVHSIDELLRYLPGVEVQTRGPMGAQSDIVIRGGTFQQVLVILDGVRLNDPNTGHFNSYIPIAPSEIERIEVLKGASSALYGSEAVGGVIHIITKTGPHSTNRTRSFTVSAAGGEYGFGAADLGGVVEEGDTRLSAGARQVTTTGQPQRGTRGFLTNTTGSVSIAHKEGRWLSGARAALDERWFGAQNFYTTFASDTATERVRTQWYQAYTRYTGDRARYDFSTGYKDLSDYFNFNTAVPANRSRSRLWQALLTREQRITRTALLTTGIQYINKSIASNDRGEHEVGQAALLAQWLQEVGTRFTAVPAIRAEWNGRSGWEVIPQVNLAYRHERWGLRASGGKTIRDADFTERFNNFERAFVPSGRIGNPDLLPERSFSWEAGADYQPAGSFKLSATFFQRRQSRLIDYVPTPYSQMPRRSNLSPTGSYALAKNIARVRTQGVEGDAVFSRTLSRSRALSASAGLVLLRSRTEDSVSAFYISSHARQLLNFSFRYAARRVAFSMTGLYKKRNSAAAAAIGAKLTPDYTVLNARGEAFVLPGALSLFLQVDNLTDRTYTDLLGAVMPGRWTTGGLRLTL